MMYVHELHFWKEVHLNLIIMNDPILEVCTLGKKDQNFYFDF
jgi:hypothetical protein